MEDVEQMEGGEREENLRTLFSSNVWLTWALMALNILLFLGAWIWGHRLFGNDLLTAKGSREVVMVFYSGMKVTPLVQQGQWWRLLSSAFVHMDMMHIFFNMYGLYAIGPLVERAFGRWKFTLIYLATALLSTLASFWLTELPSGGASGALYGLVGAVLVFGYKSRQELPERVTKQLTRGMLPWVVFGIGIGFLDFANMPMDNAAHIGGLVSGGLLALGLRSRISHSPERRIPEVLIKGCALGMLALTIWSAIGWGQEVFHCLGSLDAYATCYATR